VAGEPSETVRKEVRMQRGVVSLVIFAVLLLLSLAPPADAQTKKIEMAYSAISASHATLYFTKEAGIFEKHGLSVNLNYVASGSRVAQALLAGEFPVAFAGSAVVFANLSSRWAASPRSSPG